MILYLQSALYYSLNLVGETLGQSQTIPVFSLKMFLKEMRCGHTRASFLKERTLKVKAVRSLMSL